MAKIFALSFYKSQAWQNCRASYIAKRKAIDGGICERCHEQLGYIVHHKIYISKANVNNQDITLNHDNLEFVCKQCHDIEHFVPSEKKLLCHFDELGRPIRSANAEECDESHEK